MHKGELHEAWREERVKDERNEERKRGKKERKGLWDLFFLCFVTWVGEGGGGLGCYHFG